MPEAGQPVGSTPEEAQTRFSSTLPVIILTRPSGTQEDWQEVDRGPGYFNIPADQEIRVRIKGIDDSILPELVSELEGVEMLRFLDLAENRNITNQGMERLRSLKMLTGMNLSSVSISSQGLDPLRSLPHLTYLNLSYCNKLSDPALKIIESMRNLEFVDLQGCLGITKGGLSRIRRKNLTIYR